MLFLIFICWIICEIFQYIYNFMLYLFIKSKRYFYLQNDAVKMEQYLDTLTNIELKEFIESTILSIYKDSITINDIPRENMIKWVSFLLYFQSLWQLSDDQLDNTKKVLENIETRLSHTFINGNDTTIYVVRFGNNKIEYFYKPFIYYCLMLLFKIAVYTILSRKGYQIYKSKNEVIYFYKKEFDTDDFTIFYHGIGLGIAPYINFIDKISKKCNIMFPILPNISNLEYHSYIDYFSHNKLFPDYDKWTEDTKEIITKFEVNKLNLIGHSFGTLLVSYLDKNIDINKVVFLDPICFIDGCYKIYQYLDNSVKDNFVGKVTSYIVYNDIYTRYVIQRFIYGPKFWIYNYKDIASDKYFIVLSELDKIVPSKILATKFLKNGINYHIAKDAVHTDIFMDSKYNDIIDFVIKFLN